MRYLQPLCGAAGLLLVAAAATGQHGLDEDGSMMDAFAGGIANNPPSCPWDCAIPHDKAVDTIDFLALLAQWGSVGTPCDFGLGNPGVDTPDFLDLLAHWGPCPPPLNDECGNAIVIDRVLVDETITLDFDMYGATASLPPPACVPAPSKDIWYCLQNNSNFPKGVTVTTSLPLTIEIYQGCACPPGPLLICGTPPPQFDMLPGDAVAIRLINTQLPNDQLKGQLTIQNKSPGEPVNFYLDPVEFQTAMELAGKQQKLIWDFNPNSLPAASVVSLDDGLNILTHGLEPDDPWTDAGGNDLWPPEVDNVTFTSNTTPGGPVTPLGIDGLAFATTGFGGLSNNVLVANQNAAALDILSGPPAGDNHTAFGLELVKPVNDGIQATWVITVYDKLEQALGSFTIVLAPLQKRFLGIQAKLTTIGRIEIHDLGTAAPFEAISSLSAWQVPGGVNLYLDPGQFSQAVEDAGKATKFAWGFKPDHLQPGGPCVSVLDPLNINTHFNNAPGVWSGPLGNLWPPEVDNVTFTSNANPQGALIPGPGMLYCKGPSADFPYDNNGLLARNAGALDVSLDILSGPPAGDNHTAISLELVAQAPTGTPPRYHITVFDKQEMEIGKFVVDAPAGAQKVFAGILSKDPTVTIGRIDVWDEFGSQEGISAIAAYQQVGPPGDSHDIEPCPPGDCPPPTVSQWCVYTILEVNDPLQQCNPVGIFPGATICVTPCPFPGDEAACLPVEALPFVTFNLVGTACTFVAAPVDGCMVCPPGAPGFHRIN